MAHMEQITVPFVVINTFFPQCHLSGCNTVRDTYYRSRKEIEEAIKIKHNPALI